MARWRITVDVTAPVELDPMVLAEAIRLNADLKAAGAQVQVLVEHLPLEELDNQ